VSRRPIASVRVLQRPDLGEDCLRIEVDCRYSTTGITSIPSERVGLPVPALITAACFEHEARCGRCDASEVHAAGNRALREETERIWTARCQARTRRYTEEAMN
jgi:hypothetical protein